MSQSLPSATSSAADDINHLHDEVMRLTTASGQYLRTAVAMAWRAGGLLIGEKKRVRQMMGGGAWLTWLENNFKGTARTAQRYMCLARAVADPSGINGMSLRMLYARLGIATEPKSRAGMRLACGLPSHVTLANRLSCALRLSRKCGPLTGDRLTNYRRDLRPLYDLLRPIFETVPTAEFSTAAAAASADFIHVDAGHWATQARRTYASPIVADCRKGYGVSLNRNEASFRKSSPPFRDFGDDSNEDSIQPEEREAVLPRASRRW